MIRELELRLLCRLLEVASEILGRRRPRMTRARKSRGRMRREVKIKKAEMDYYVVLRY